MKVYIYKLTNEIFVYIAEKMGSDINQSGDRSQTLQIQQQDRHYRGYYSRSGFLTEEKVCTPAVISTKKKKRISIII